MNQKRSIQIETLTDVQMTVGESVQTTDSTQEKQDCVFFLLHGYYPTEDRDIEIPTFLSIEKARELGILLIELTVEK
ncbi:hypothetical protein G7050_17180 [Dysgonomonas sp. HDW5A]|uniref:hypothetical protein n=1 Tax=Dysgonomonas sp. HDW5A TaxID=2714926 RepID=UPI001408B5F8|nr:hypothetical protein [Dysgonomonas sp. HDW5A]QIK61483.1 hypothetical protein G7050_17180 [Dysgonomonas sp. HDW5A]